MRSKELGISIDKVIVIKALNFDKEAWSTEAGGYVIDSIYMRKADLFKNEIRSYSSIVNATSLSHLPGQVSNWGTEFKAKSINPEKAFRLRAIGIDYDFIQTLQVKLLAGRNFSPAFPSDQGNEVKRAMKAIVSRLRTDPVSFGEPLYRMAKLEMMVRCAAISPLFVEYGIHDSERVIVIRKVRWLVDPSTP